MEGRSRCQRTVGLVPARASETGRSPRLRLLALLSTTGGVAQLVERLTGSQEVRGFKSHRLHRGMFMKMLTLVLGAQGSDPIKVVGRDRWAQQDWPSSRARTAERTPGRGRQKIPLSAAFTDPTSWPRPIEIRQAVMPKGIDWYSARSAGRTRRSRRRGRSTCNREALAHELGCLVSGVTGLAGVHGALP